MARFSVGGDEDENDERHSDRRRPKKPRFTTPVSNTQISPNAAAASTPNSGNRAGGSTSSAPQAPTEEEMFPEIPLAAGEESEKECEEESDHARPSDSSPGSEEESDADEQNQQSDDEVQPTETRFDWIQNGNGTRGDSDGDTGSITVTLTDRDVLDCPICFDPLTAPVYQCDNGHIACGSCCTSMHMKCASCQQPIGYSRCRAIERVIESASVRCWNLRYGCKEKFNYNKKLSHESTCIYAPCSCPDIYCDYVAMSMCLYAHFASLHYGSSRHFSFNTPMTITLLANGHLCLQETKHSVVFVLNRSDVSAGNSVSVVCVAPSSTKREFLYSVAANCDESSIKLETLAECVPKWRPQDLAKVSLVVPSNFVFSGGKLVLEVKIWRRSSVVG